jgi:hypothetical protein
MTTKTLALACTIAVMPVDIAAHLQAFHAKEGRGSL